ncbi:MULTISPECIES: acetylglutamate kinase [unclassified Kaistella]|uniref:acetylglutamate kinase n=1 Tax=unclassified Kaistella TaxID=2762626 RepID=UPI002732AE90|nr:MULTISPECIES: acetylglutamate kinase [unclassified Kaistella]MDP2454662.1 acetylglutamate kinase [Kaistella sp. SH11-4b]MDP2457399.1 acetylglutamate kinase [Kaistella sp. SH40-3]MDP2460159.1 acetylglutamate kinase [Kaistella sp. SH19-2b]
MDKQKLYVIKIGGSLIDKEKDLMNFLEGFASIKASKLLVHGGGKLASDLAEKLNIPQQMTAGRRVTNQETLDIVTMVYAGKINKNIVAKLQTFQCNAIGFSGADGNLIKSEKRSVSNIDYGFVGDVDSKSVNVDLLKEFLNLKLIPVFSAITHDKKGNLFNTNADSIASVLAISLSNFYEVELLYCFDKDGILENVENPESIVKTLNPIRCEQLKFDNKLNKGILPKLENAFKAKENKVNKVVLLNETKFQNQIKFQNEGTEINI